MLPIVGKQNQGREQEDRVHGEIGSEGEGQHRCQGLSGNGLGDGMQNGAGGEDVGRPTQARGDGQGVEEKSTARSARVLVVGQYGAAQWAFTLQPPHSHSISCLCAPR